MDLKLEGMVSPKKVQEYATNQLGMIESSEKNVEYIRLTQENKIEVPEGAAGTVWERIGSFFTGILS